MFFLHEPKKNWLMVLLAAFFAIGANLPTDWTQLVSLDRRYLMAALVALLAVALVRYLNFSLTLVVVILAFGARLPIYAGDALGIAPVFFSTALLVMVLWCLALRWKRLPAKPERPGRPASVQLAIHLMHAAAHGEVEAMIELVHTGTNVNVRTVHGSTPLMQAAYRGDRQMTKLLLEAGADPLMARDDGVTALRFAEDSGHKVVANMLRSAQLSALSSSRRNISPPPRL